MRPILYVDMDDTICIYKERYEELLKLNPEIKYPQSQYGFYTSLKPIKGAIETLEYLDAWYDIYILTRPSYKNPLCYTEKRVWVEKHMGIDWCEKLILCPNKSLMKGDFLVDDYLWKDFEGKQLQFGTDDWPNWEVVKDYLFERAKDFYLHM
jgi:5'(3')-deoxyribonucleotidase